LAPVVPPSPGKADLKQILVRTDMSALFDKEERERNKGNQAFQSLEVNFSIM
jgi:hypothetical protein